MKSSFPVSENVSAVALEQGFLSLITTLRVDSHSHRNPVLPGQSGGF